jgi:hypothetical protein
MIIIGNAAFPNPIPPGNPPVIPVMISMGTNTISEMKKKINAEINAVRSTLIFFS